MPDTDLVSPASFVPGDDKKPIDDGIAVCLSGGGYRAMLFHTGVLWRLLEFGLLSPGNRTAKRPDGTSMAVGTFERISSVSGGSIISAMLGHKWKSSGFHLPSHAGRDLPERGRETDSRSRQHHPGFGDARRRRQSPHRHRDPGLRATSTSPVLTTSTSIERQS